MIDDITFTINKSVNQNRIVKNINFERGRQQYNFSENVCLWPQFKQMLSTTGFTITDTYGNYRMESYAPATADRLLLICKNNHA